MARKKSAKRPQGEDSNTVVVINLPFTVEEASLRKYFSECGKIIDIRIPRDHDGDKARGLAFIKFETKDAFEEALTWENKDYEGRAIRVKKATESGDRKGKGDKGNSKGKGKGKGPTEKPDGCLSVFVKISKQTEEDTLRKTFEKCGTITDIKILKDKETWESKGAAFIDFETTEATDKAVKLSGTELDKWSVTVNYNAPRDKGKGKDGKGKDGKGKDGKGKGKGKGKDGKGKGKDGKGKGKKGKGENGAPQPSGKKQTFDDSDSD